MHRVYLPELGEGIKKATIARWHVACGNKVTSDDDIVELVTDKASFNVSAGKLGTVKEICVKEGEEANIGEVLAVIET